MIAVLPYVIHPKTAVLGRAGGGGNPTHTFIIGCSKGTIMLAVHSLYPKQVICLEKRVDFGLRISYYKLSAPIFLGIKPRQPSYYPTSNPWQMLAAI